ncbi:hypothetical protein GH714_022186 [Hevea brasiliensis]|uniref:ENT domain-containing protein n=1 Tax=Hevea brasiliensis TaxID=3981 RepID=A0A6A6M238_HEVBR|nr:hypothetical protein GH714_022186 [Hevea brasiliensis]
MMRNINSTPYGHSSGAPRVSLLEEPYAKDELDINFQIHSMEKEAYCSVLRAFNAQSDLLSWTNFKDDQQLGEFAVLSSVQSMKVVNHNFQGPLSNKRGPAQSHVKKGIHMPDSGKFKNRSEFIEIRATDTIIHEVERMTYGRENPDPVQVEKAKLILRDHERAILGALDKLANVSDVGNTAAEYFCSSSENLSKILKLSPSIAGVTLLSLGNGAPDVFASIISFTRSSNADVGLNSILGGAFFVSSGVVGVIRKITLWAAISFLSMYFFYVCVGDVVEMGIPLLGYVDDEKPNLVDKTNLEDEEQSPICFCLYSSFCYYLGRFLNILELPLYLPRRLTIPVASEERWAKTYAVTSVTLAPLLLGALCDTQREKKLGSRSSLVIYMTTGLIGMVLGNLAFVTTKKSSPPTKCLFLWLAAGFVMSVTWTHIIAEELVSLLVSQGFIFGINPSVLGLTVLAWGNSLGDLLSNVAMAMNGGEDGAQVAISGCYAGPMFNTLLGLGLSFVLSSWSKYPYSFVIARDPSLYETLGFLMAGLLWALVILPRKNMRLDKPLGVGLLAIYFCFLCLRLARALGVSKLHRISLNT